MSSKEIKTEISDLLEKLETASEVFRISDEITASFNGKDSATVLSINSLVSAKVIFGVSSSREKAIAILGTHFSKVYDMIGMFYDEQEEEAEEATKQ